jgi:hypothetical protein
LNSNQNSNLILKEKHLNYFIVLIYFLLGFVLKEREEEVLYENHMRGKRKNLGIIK